MEQKVHTMSIKSQIHIWINIFDHPENASPNNTQIPFHINQNGYHEETIANASEDGGRS